MTIDVYRSSDIFNSVNKKFFPYYALYKDLLNNTDSALFYSNKCSEPVGVMILRPGADEDTLHISCIEVAEPIRRNGWGSKINKCINLIGIQDISFIENKDENILKNTISELKNEVNGVYKRITLRCLSPNLVPFYLRNGFRLVNTDPNNLIMEAHI